VLEIMIDNQSYSEYKPLLFAIAYRMVGMITEAEDIVHDVLLAYEKVSREQIENKKAYLCKMVTNRSIDYLKSAKKQREVYIGPWLPEPLIIAENEDPLHEVLRQDEISYALLSLMEQLNPVERAVFVLREAFDYEYGEIASILEKEEANCRKVLSRARKKLNYNNTKYVNRNEKELNQFVQSFLYAAATGNTEGLLRMLTNDAVLYSDGGGKVKAALVPIVSQERVVQFILGLLRKFGNDNTMEIDLANVNGEFGIVIKRNNELENVVCFEIENNQISHIFLIRNPEKLKHVNKGISL
jgi:RNA polymerase sigma-70 factor, ECF subfamily